MAKIGFGLACAAVLASGACAGHARSGRAASSSSGDTASGAQAGSNGAATTGTGQAAQGSTAPQGSATAQSSPAGQASASSPSSVSKSVEGRVEQLDRAGNLTLAGTEAAGHAFDRLKVDSRTEITANGEKATIGQLNEGDEVRASFSGQGDELHVDRLEIVTKGQ